MHLTRHAIRALLADHRDDALPEHLQTCARCRTIADEIALDTRLGDELAWQLASLPELPAAEDGRALEQCASGLLSRGIDAADLVRDSRLATEEGLLSLLRAAHPLLNVSPARLRDIADAILALDPVDAVAVVAHRERANALRRTGDLAGALESIAQGRDDASRLVVSDHELAIFDYIEALVLSDRSQLAEARTLALRALGVFKRFGDTRRVLYARLFLGVLDYEAGSFESAREVFRSVAPPLARLGDRAAALGAIHNAGDCSRQLHDLAAARCDFLEAKAGYEELGLETPLLSIDWVLARIALEQGQYDEAELQLIAVAHGHDARGMKLNAALARLDLVDLYRLTGRMDTAVALARDIASVFVSAGARGRLADALSVLREAAERGFPLDEPLREARKAFSATPASEFHF